MFNRIIENVFDPILDCTLIAPTPPKDKRRKIEEVSKSAKDQFDGIVEMSEEGEVVAGEGFGEERRERVGKRVLEKLFEEGGKKDTGEVNRRKIYKVCRARNGEEE